MASDAIKWVLLAGGAYLVYRAYSATVTVSPAPGSTSGGSGSSGGSSGSSGSGSGSGSGYSAPSLADQLDAAAQPNAFYQQQGKRMNAWQWEYVWENSLKKTAIDGAQLSAVFFPNGAPAAAQATSAPWLMSAAQFVSGLQAKGLAGLDDGRGTRLVTIPVIFHPGPGGRRAMALPAGTRPADLQAQLARVRGRALGLRNRNYVPAGSPMPGRAVGRNYVPASLPMVKV